MFPRYLRPGERGTAPTASSTRRRSSRWSTATITTPPYGADGHGRHGRHGEGAGRDGHKTRQRAIEHQVHICTVSCQPAQGERRHHARRTREHRVGDDPRYLVVHGERTAAVETEPAHPQQYDP